MASDAVRPLPPAATFPKAAWRTNLIPEEWVASLDAWILLVEAHLSLSASDFQRISAKDESIVTFLLSFMSETALSSSVASLGDSLRWKVLWRHNFWLSNRLFRVEKPPETLLSWEFLSDFCRVYGKIRSAKAISTLWVECHVVLERNLANLKAFLIERLEIGDEGNSNDLEQKLKRLSHLLHSSPETASFFMNGTDFLDGLVSCYRLMNPPLQKAIICTAYLSLLGLAKGPSQKFSLLTDQLYSLKAAGESQNFGPNNVNNSFVAELVTVTPILNQIQRCIDDNETSSGRAKSVISSLERFRKAREGRSKNPIKRKVDKGKEILPLPDEHSNDNSGEIHMHRMSLITQVQDLFPDLGSRFVMKLLDEYDEDVEQVISHLLEGSLPAHFMNADRREVLGQENPISDEKALGLTPESTFSLMPTRRNVFDDDEFDQLAIDASRLHFGRNHDKIADDILKDRSKAPTKAAILSALAAFDSDDDERDDTYDVEDVGGTVDSATPGNNPEEAITDPIEEVFFRAFKVTPHVFGRDATTRRSELRMALKEETGVTDEVLEGWALVLSRDPQQMRRLEAKYSSFSGVQQELTTLRGEAGGSGTEDSDGGGRGGQVGNRVYRGRGSRGRGGKKGGNVAGRAGERETELARQRKEANKGPRANHNRRDQRAKKMARGGFPS